MTGRSAPPRDNSAAMLAAASEHHRAGRLRDAEGLYRQVLQQDPGNAQAHNLLGVLAAQSGHPEAAAELLKRAVELDGANPEFHFNLGLVRQGGGDREGAIASYRRAVEIHPGYADAWSNLGGLLLGKGDAEGAERCHRKAVEIAPANPLAQHNLGASLLVRQAYGGAEACFREALRLKPDYAEAHNSLALSLGGLGRLDAAGDSLREALRLKPNYAEAHSNLGYVLFEQDRLDEAVAEIEAALRLKPGDAKTRIKLAQAETERENLETALELYEAILRGQPDHEGALAGKAGILDRKGQREEAGSIVRPFAESGSLPTAMVPLYEKLWRGAGRQAEAVAFLEAMAARETLTPEGRRGLEFALGSLNDSLGHYDAAFAHYAEGNALRTVDYDPAATAESFDRRIAFFSAERFASLPRAEDRSELPVFIFGMPRSGTTLVEQILSCHPRVRAAGELSSMQRLSASLGLDFQPREGAPPEPETGEAAFAAASREYLDMLREKASGAERVTDKMPYNFEQLGLISRLLPGARVIHCSRDPLDTCLSCYFQNFARGNFQTNDLRHLGRYYRQYRRLMEHWRGMVDLTLLEVSYEAHVEAPERVCREILDFLGLEWEPRCLEFHTAKRFVKTASREQVQKPIYRSSVGRWRHYEAHLGPLKEALAADS